MGEDEQGSDAPFSSDGLPDLLEGTGPHRVVIRAAGGLDQIGWEDAPIAEPGMGQVRVRVEAAGAAATACDALTTSVAPAGSAPGPPSVDM